MSTPAPSGRRSEPRPPAVGRLALWWLVAAAFAAGVLWAVTDHMLRATVTMGASLVLGAVLRLTLPARAAGGLVTRGRAFDVIFLVLLAAAVLAAGFALDLRARV
ncbi:MAG: DUF3017 domain-containing protein [Tetrasphaera sp.]